MTWWVCESTVYFYYFTAVFVFEEGNVNKVGDMKKLKGTILELIIENLLKACGYKSVLEDGIYVHRNGDGLRYVNGKGSNHDADVLMVPPYQIPFAYPVRLLVECKAYNSNKIGLAIVRSALGLQYDLNDFEIVTKEYLQQRRNNQRTMYALENRERYKYQIAVASINGFSKNAIEFACNHKIPLIDLSLLIDGISDDIKTIDGIQEEQQTVLLNIVRRHFPNLEGARTVERARQILGDDTITTVNIPLELSNVAEKTMNAMQQVLVGALTNGDTLLLTADEVSKSLLYELQNETQEQEILFTIHFDERGNRKWYGIIMYASQEIRFNFELPGQLFDFWRGKNFELNEALNVKERYLKFLTIIGEHNGRRINLNLRIPDEWFSAVRENF